MTADTTTKLIVVEGIPGSGKSTMAAFIKDWLAARGLPARLFLEGDPNHPADFEFIAFFSRPEWEQLLESHPTQRAWLESRVESLGEDRFISYHDSRLPPQDTLPEALLDELARHDVYEVPHPETYRRLARERWQAFSGAARQAGSLYIFECCLMQNPLAVLTLMHNRPVPETLGHIRDLLAILQPLNPLIIYLARQDPRLTIERAAADRPRAWVDFLIEYIAAGGWAADHRVSGFDSIVAYYQERQAAELAFLQSVETPSLVLEQSAPDYEKSRQQVAGFLSRVLG